LEGQMATGKEVVSNLGKKLGAKFGEGFYPKKVSDLMGFWGYFVPLHHQVGYLKMGEKEKCQLGHIMKALKDQPNDLMPTIRWSIEHWDVFAMLVKKEKAVTISTTPEVGKLLAFLDVAVNGMQYKVEQAKEHQPVVPKKLLPKIVMVKNQ
jgi:hypothetical protein